jgi:predicted deacylase
VATRNWKEVAATSLPNAIELCIEHGKDRFNLSVDRLAHVIGLANKYTLYKWIESGRVPAISIAAIELACGCDFITRYLAHSAGKLLLDIPTGRKADSEDIQRLQSSCLDAVGALIDFHKGERSADQTREALTEAMEALAWHRENVAKTQAPEFDFGGAP